MYKKLLFLFVLSCWAVNAQQINNPRQTITKAAKSFFIQNKGQWDPEVKYLARIGGMNAWITNSGVVYDYYRIKKNNNEAETTGNPLLRKLMNPKEIRDFEIKNTVIEGNVVKMQLVNEEKEVISLGNDKREGYYNYFIGNNQSKWANYVPLYDNVELQGVYKNIDVKYYYDNGMLRYDYNAKPGADLSQIKFKFEGQEGISINSKGELILKTSLGEVTNGKIYAYQMEGEIQKEVGCKFEQKENGTIGLKITGYDAMKELIIDPLIYSTFVGGSGASDWGTSIAVDAGGNAYITGQTRSGNYPTTTGAYQTTVGDTAFGCAFITKINPTGAALVYSTFIGGSNGHDWGTSIAVDANGNTYLTGSASSSNYPVTNGVYQTTLRNINGNAFITKLNPTGSALIYSTFIGGSINLYSYGDVGNSIAIDEIGNAYITGSTRSSDYPTTSGAYQTIGGADAFITKLNSTGSALVYSTFIGGCSDDEGNSIAIDTDGNAYITGQTYSSDYPTTSGAFQTTSNGYYDAFVTKLNSTGSSIIYSTYAGGDSNDVGTSIAIDAGGNAYITGETYSSNYPVTSGAFQTTIGNNNEASAFVTKLNSTGSRLVYSTFIGGSGNSYSGDWGNSIAIDSYGNAYFTGYSGDGYPTTSGAFQTTGNGVFITKLNLTGSSLIYSTLIQEGTGYSIAIDTSGNAYITGLAVSDYPTTNGSYQTTFGGGHSDAFITKFNLSPATSVESNSQPVPNKFELMQNYPNPFNPSTVISYDLPFSSNVKIEVYNILGKKIRELLNGQKNAGYYKINFNTTGLASGIYLYSIVAKSTDGKSEFRNTKKMILLK